MGVEGACDFLESGVCFSEGSPAECALVLLVAGGDWGNGGCVIAAAVFAKLGELIKKGEEPVIIALGEGIVFVVVAAGALRGESQPGRAEGSDAVADVFDPVLFVDDAALAVDYMIAAKTGGEALLGGGVGEEISCELFGEELAVGNVLIKGVDDPFAPAPHITQGVVVEAVSVGVAGDVQPFEGLAFAVVGGCQEALYGAGVSGFPMGGDVAEEGVPLRGGRGYTDEVQAGAAQPCLRGGLRRGLQPLLLQSRQNEAIERLPDPGGVLDGWKGRPFWRNKSPVSFVGRPLGDPAFDQLDLFWGNGAIGLGGRHQVVAFVGCQAFDEFAVLRLSWDNCGVAAEIPSGPFTFIEAEFGLAMAGVHPMAVKTVLGEDRTDIPVEGERGFRPESGDLQQNKTQNQPEFQRKEGDAPSPLKRW